MRSVLLPADFKYVKSNIDGDENVLTEPVGAHLNDCMHTTACLQSVEKYKEDDNIYITMK